MKIYRFNPENGFYLGEDFADEPPMRGTSEVPPDATTIAPPTAKGMIPFFDVHRQQWELRTPPAPAGLLFHGKLDGECNQAETRS